MMKYNALPNAKPSPIFILRGKRTGAFEIVSSIALFVLSAFIVLAELLGFILFMSFMFLTLTFGVISLIFATLKWRRIFHVLFFWIYGSVAISLVVVIFTAIGLGFTFNCLVDLGSLCTLTSRIVIVTIFGGGYFLLKGFSCYNVFLMRRELIRNAKILIEISELQSKVNPGEGTSINEQRNDEVQLEESNTTEEMASDQYEVAIKRFNVKPKRGIEYLLEVGVIESMDEKGAQQVADWLFNNEGDKINKIKIGEYIGNNDEFCQKVLSYFVNKMDFSQKPIDMALRMFLRKFVLPKETEKIERIIEKFACRYHANNPNTFRSADTACILAFSMMMLHTDAHNPNVKQKMTKEEWYRNNRGIDEGRDLPQEFLSQLYDRIVGEEIMMFDVDKRGWLYKHSRNAGGGPQKPWKRRWFVLSNNCLFYFKHPSDKEFRVNIPLEGICVAKATHSSRKYCIILYDLESSHLKSCKRHSNGDLEVGIHEFLLLSAETSQERDEWLDVLQRNISRDPFYDIIKSKIATVNERMRMSQKVRVVESLRRFGSMTKKAKDTLEQLYGTAPRSSFVQLKRQKPKVTEELFRPPETVKIASNTDTNEKMQHDKEPLEGPTNEEGKDDKEPFSLDSILNFSHDDKNEDSLSKLSDAIVNPMHNDALLSVVNETDEQKQQKFNAAKSLRRPSGYVDVVSTSVSHSEDESKDEHKDEK